MGEEGVRGVRVQIEAYEATRDVVHIPAPSAWCITSDQYWPAICTVFALHWHTGLEMVGRWVSWGQRAKVPNGC